MMNRIFVNRLFGMSCFGESAYWCVTACRIKLSFSIITSNVPEAVS